MTLYYFYQEIVDKLKLTIFSYFLSSLKSPYQPSLGISNRCA